MASRNKEIARSLGICPGTVKIYLKHIFEKTEFAVGTASPCPA
jgi:DNA-binding NarL/FixJ family response regulator